MLKEKMILETKKCNLCNKLKPVGEFYKYPKNRNGGYRPKCKNCMNQLSKQWREYRSGYYKEYYKNNKEKIERNFYIWRKNNPDKIKMMRKKDHSKRKSNIQRHINDAISCLIRISLKKGKGNNHWENLVGYKLQDLIIHLEKQFKDGMDWEKFIKGEIHIDHVIPISLWNFKSFTDREFKQCWSLCNLQPLWALDNMRKGNKLITVKGDKK